MSDGDEPDCPTCGTRLEALVGYSHGHKTSDGWRCPDDECSEENWLWGDWDEQPEARSGSEDSDG